MANPYFKFKQFTIWHDKCAMKVGTDGVLLGASAPVTTTNSILDVGTGTGLIALMLAQRTVSAQIKALEIDEDAVIQAKENIERSPWKDRIEVIQSDFNLYEPNEKYDLIVSNPPYFVDSLLSPHKQRTNARHTQTLSFDALLDGVVRCLSAVGRFSVILPIEVQDLFCGLAKDRGLFLNKILYIQTKPGASAKRIILDFSFVESILLEDTLLVELARHQYSKEYIQLTKDFYLKM